MLFIKARDKNQIDYFRNMNNFSKIVNPNIYVIKIFKSHKVRSRSVNEFVTFVSVFHCNKYRFYFLKNRNCAN